MVAYDSLKTKEKSSWVIPKVVAVAYHWLTGSVAYESEVFITKCESQSVLRGFTKVVVTRAGCLREWSQGERASTELKFIELYMGAPTCRTEPNRNICH